jgi:hypothetical protein
MSTPQGQQSRHMPAALAKQEALALTRTIDRPANPHVIQFAQAQAMDREATAADGTSDLMKRVVAGPAGYGDPKHAHPIMMG